MIPSLFSALADWDFQLCSWQELSAAVRYTSPMSIRPNSPPSQRLEALRSMRRRETPSNRFEKQPAEKEWVSRSNWLALPLQWGRQSDAWAFSAAPRSSD